MPKTTGTRKQEAKELMERLERGPSLHEPFFGEGEFNAKEAEKQFGIWCRTWIIPVVKRLVPELKEKKS